MKFLVFWLLLMVGLSFGSPASGVEKSGGKRHKQLTPVRSGCRSVRLCRRDFQVLSHPVSFSRSQGADGSLELVPLRWRSGMFPHGLVPDEFNWNNGGFPVISLEPSRYLNVRELSWTSRELWKNMPTRAGPDSAHFFG